MSQLPHTTFRLRLVTPSEIEARPKKRVSPRGEELAKLIEARIQDRLGRRVHELKVIVDGSWVVLHGRCATYYTKQLAQHAALGVLEDEHLDNQITVTQG